MRWEKFSTVMLVVACMVSFVSCSAKDDSLFIYANEFVPEDAFDVHRAPDIPWVQISFNVRRKKFEFATSEKKLAEAQSGGWMVCRPRNATWTIFIDGMTVPNRRVHERVLLLYRNGALITLVGRYYDLELSTSRDNPASVAPVQHGAVIARMVSESELRGSIDTLRLSCEGQRNGTDLFKFQQQ